MATTTLVSCGRPSSSRLLSIASSHCCDRGKLRRCHDQEAIWRRSLVAVGSIVDPVGTQACLFNIGAFGARQSHPRGQKKDEGKSCRPAEKPPLRLARLPARYSHKSLKLLCISCRTALARSLLTLAGRDR